MKRFLIVALMLCMETILFAQGIQVDHHSGAPIINFPLLTVNDRGLIHNVSLFYSASGVRVDQISGLVGTSWSLIAGGEVSRELRGLPDELDSQTQKGWLVNNSASIIGNHSYPAEGTVLDCDAETTHYSFLHSTVGYTIDTEPDVFHFAAGGISGSFVFDNTGNINNLKLIPYQDIVVKPYLVSGSLEKFEVYTPDGIKYVFSLAETTIQRSDRGDQTVDPVFFRRDYHLYKNGISYKNKWKLTSIESPEGGKITFQYTTMGSFDMVPSGNILKIALGGSNGNTPPELELYSDIRESSRPNILYSISTPHQNIVFSSSFNEYSDVNGFLNSITINEIRPQTSRYVRTINFDYKKVRSSLFGEGEFYRYFLTSIQVADDCEVHEPTLFSYNGIIGDEIDLPAPGSNNQDMWGFFYSNNATNRYPKLYIYPSQTGIKKISLFQISNQSDEIIIPGAVRSISSNSPTGLINSITYSSGATVNINYASHEFYNPITESSAVGGGFRVSSISQYDGIKTTTDILRTFEYKKADGTTSGKLLSLPTYWQVTNVYYNEGTFTDYSALSNLPIAEQWDKLLIRTEDNINPDFNTVNPIVYERVVEKMSVGKGKTVYEFDVPNTLGSIAQTDWSPSYIQLARLKQGANCPPSGLNSPGYYQHPFTYQTPYSYGRGLLTKTSWYAEGDEAPLREVINTYADKAVSDEVVKGLKLEIIPATQHVYYYMYSPYVLRTNKTKILTNTLERTRSRETPLSYLETTTSYTYGSNHSFITSVTSAQSDGSVVSTKFKYAKDFGTPEVYDQGTPLQVRMIDDLNSLYQGGTLIEQVNSRTVSGTETTYQGTLFMFDDFDNNTPKLIKPKDVLALKTSGIQNFALSTFSGSGSSRTFEKSTAYKKKAGYQYKTFGDLIRVEDDKRQFQSFHTDSLTGIPIATILNVEPHEVVFSNFDQLTKYSFDIGPEFTFTEKIMDGKSSVYGLSGWKSPNSSTRKISKTFIKRPGSKYVLSAWYKASGTTGTHVFNVVIRDASGAQLLTEALTYTVTEANAWYYNEKVIDLSTISNEVIKIEINFTGTFSTKLTGAIIDDVTFAPEEALLSKSSYSTAFGQTSQTSVDGLISENELDPAGKLKYARDNEGNIRQKASYSSYKDPSKSSLPISIATENIIYDGSLTHFTASTSCIDISTMQWKVEPSSAPGTGTYFDGSDYQSYTFASAGTYTVWLKTTHSTYGIYEVSKIVTVELRPLAVSVCIEQGPTTVDLCNYPNMVMETEHYLNCPTNTLGLVPMDYTIFSATVDGCDAGATYTYQWLKRPYSSYDEPWESIPGATSPTIQMWNFEGNGYFVKCIVSSSCNRSGESNNGYVFIYRSNPECQGPFGE